MVGSSMGGIITTYAGLKYPHIFKKTASLSSAYWFYMDELIDLIHRSDLSATQCFYLDLGGNEGNGDEEMSRIYYESNETIYNELIKKIGSKDGSLKKLVTMSMNGVNECRFLWTYFTNKKIIRGFNNLCYY